MAAAEEQKAILYVLRILRTEGDEWMRHKRTSAAAIAKKSAEGKFDAIDAQELETHFLHRGKTGEFDENKVIFVKPPAKDPTAVAGIWCRWNYDKGLPRCGFYYGLWSAQPAFPLTAPDDDARHPAFVGYRFETPEDGDNHNFYHAQPCRSMGAKDDPVEHGLPISVRDPTWPLAAGNALELLLCVVTSLYGLKGLRELQDTINEDNTLRHNVPIKAALSNLLALGRNTD